MITIIMLCCGLICIKRFFDEFEYDFECGTHGFAAHMSTQIGNNVVI